MELTTIDESGRIQLPQTVMQQLGLQSNDELFVEIQDGKLILTPVPEEPELFYEEGVLVFKAKPIGNWETIIEDQRKERISQFMLW